MQQPSRTLNPLHFEDLEPHRFEDLVRQLIYDFKQWKSLEAIGRSGSDEGIDIRGLEYIRNYEAIYTDESNQEVDPNEDQSESRQWIVQCKRQKVITPGQVREIITSLSSSNLEKIYGYILVSSCNFSKKSQDVLNKECSKLGIQECFAWGKSELEDQIFLPKNDHLLFAYFGISLQIRRKSVKTDTRAKIALKRKLVRELGSIENPNPIPVFIRDPRDENYPRIASVKEFVKFPLWRYWKFHSHEAPYLAVFVHKQHYAYVDWEKKEYDFLPGYDYGIPYNNMTPLNDRWWDPDNIGNEYNDLWFKIPEKNRAWYTELRAIDYDRIIAFDEIGDNCSAGPHLLVEYSSDGTPFNVNSSLIYLESPLGNSIILLEHPKHKGEDAKHISYFNE